MWSQIGRAKAAFQKIRKVLRHMKMSLESKKIIFSCYVISNILYDSEALTIFSEVLRNIKTYFLIIRKIHLRLLRQLMGKAGQEK